MKRLVAAVLVLALAGMARAADKSDATGTWKWKVDFGGQSREMTLKLKLDGDKLTGSMIGRDKKETPIDNAKYKDGDLSFQVTRERQGQKFTFKYTGKLTGDTIKGKTEFERDGKAQTRDWEAKRAKE